MPMHVQGITKYMSGLGRSMANGHACLSLLQQACLSFNYLCIYVSWITLLVSLSILISIIHAFLTVEYIRHVCPLIIRTVHASTVCLFYYIRHVCPLNIHYPCMSDCSNTTGMSVLWISMHVWLLQYSRHACPLNIHACLSFVLQQTCLTDMVCPLNILYMHLCMLYYISHACPLNIHACKLSSKYVWSIQYIYILNETVLNFTI